MSPTTGVGHLAAGPELEVERVCQVSRVRVPRVVALDAATLPVQLVSPTLQQHSCQTITIVHFPVRTYLVCDTTSWEDKTILKSHATSLLNASISRTWNKKKVSDRPQVFIY